MGNMISSLVTCCDTRLPPYEEASQDDICTLCMAGNVDLVSRTLTDFDGRVDTLGSALRDDGPVGIRRTLDKYALVADPPPGRQYRATALHFAVLVGDVDVTQVLLENGADPSVASEQGFSALDMAPCLTHIPTMERIGAMLRKAQGTTALLNHGYKIVDGDRRDPTTEDLEQISGKMRRALSSTMGNMPTRHVS